MNFIWEKQKIFLYDELPEETKNEINIQLDSLECCDDSTGNPCGCLYELCELNCDDIISELDEIYGPNLIDALEDDYIIELADDIKVNGLKFPPVGHEGIHRKLAFAYLKKSIPYLRIILPQVNENV